MLRNVPPNGSRVPLGITLEHHEVPNGELLPLGYDLGGWWKLLNLLEPGRGLGLDLLLGHELAIAVSRHQVGFIFVDVVVIICTRLKLYFTLALLKVPDLDYIIQWRWISNYT